MKTKKKRVEPWWRRIWAHHSVRWVLAGVLVLIMVQQTARWWNPVVFPPVQDAQMGVSFSTKQTNMFDLDPQETFRALLDDMGVRHFRLMSYWDVHESVQGKRDFSSLDWQIAEAKKRNADVTLAIGLRQPRWPECHEPDWATNLDIIEWRRALNDYISTVVKRYENEPTIISWQLENEFSNGLFAKCRDSSLERLQIEFDLVKSLSKKPVWMSLSDQGGYPARGPRADRWGFSVYRTVWSTGLYTGYMTFPVPIWYHNLRKNVIEAGTGKDTFIHELQLEPWGPTDIPYLTTEQQNQSMSTKQIHDSLLFARELGMKDIYSWGGEWWYWRKLHGDPTVWNTVKDEFRKASTN
jgi:hypothetical protein